MVPTQTLFAQRMPPGMMGRVVAFRGSLAFGALNVAMAVSGLMAEVIPAGIVIAIFGFVTLGAGGRGGFPVGDPKVVSLRPEVEWPRGSACARGRGSAYYGGFQRDRAAVPPGLR